MKITEICINRLMLGVFLLCFGKVSKNGMLDFLLFRFKIEDLLHHASAGPNDKVIRSQHLLER